MEQANLITKVAISQPKPVRGRPRAYFSLAPVKRFNNMISLADALLHLLVKTEDTTSEIKNLVEIARHILPPGTAAATLTQRLNHLVKELTGLGYQARWEAHADGPQVVFRNCPYHPLPDKYPELCRMDALVIQQNLGVAEPVQIAKIHIPIKPSCRFVIKEN